MNKLNRRQFCVVAGAAVVGACGGGGSPGGGADLAVASDMATLGPDLVNPGCAVNGISNAGPAATLAVGAPRLIDCVETFVIRDAGGIYAMTALCTHQGCAVQYAPATNDFGCPCHGSTFDINGNVTMPPAPLPLDHYAVSIDAGSGDILVDTNTKVSPSTRTPG